MPHKGPDKEAIAALPRGATDYILSAVWWNAQLGGNSLSKAFTDGFREKHGGRTPEWPEALAHESARALFAAIEKAGTKDREAVREALASLKMNSILPGGYLAFPQGWGGWLRRRSWMALAVSLWVVEETVRWPSRSRCGAHARRRCVTQ